MLAVSASFLIIAALLRPNRVSLGLDDDLAGVEVVLEPRRYLSVNRVEEHRGLNCCICWRRTHARIEEDRQKFNELKDLILINFERLSCDYFLVAIEEKFFFAKYSQRVVEIAIKKQR